MIVTEKQNKELLKEMKEKELILMGLRMEKQLLSLLVQGSRSLLLYQANIQTGDY